MNKMNDLKENFSVRDSRDFRYEVQLEHSPHFGFSTAYYNGRVIAQCDFQKLHEPYSDDDREWEWYEQKLGEWKDEVKSNLQRSCREYFDNKKIF